MGIGIPEETDQASLARFLKHRQAKVRVVGLLKHIKERHDLKKGDVTTSQSASYDKLVSSLDVALKEDWLSHAELTASLDAAEVAGRQHVLLYNVKTSKVSTLASLLTTPDHAEASEAAIDEYVFMRVQRIGLPLKVVGF